jgi:hypothetical protein
LITETREQEETGPAAILLLGMPRSGTTWLGQIFDSHPGTIVRHEPDTVHPTTAFPFVLSPEELEQHHAAAKHYLQHRLADRELRCVLGGHAFTKTFRHPVSHRLRQALMVAAKSLDTLAAGRLERRLTIPDLVSASATALPILKSVDSPARTPMFARACPEYCFVYLIRHPCGVVGSKLRGAQLGKLPPGEAYSDWLRFTLARECGLQQHHLASWSQLEIAAWGWTLTNDFVLRTASSQPNVCLLSYDALCRDPLAMTQAVFANVGVSWSEQTADYLRSCLRTDSTATAYYSTRQNPAAAAFRWQTELSAEEIDQIMSIAAHSKLCMTFLENNKVADRPSQPAPARQAV